MSNIQDKTVFLTKDERNSINNNWLTKCTTKAQVVPNIDNLNTYTFNNEDNIKRNDFNNLINNCERKADGLCDNVGNNEDLAPLN